MDIHILRYVELLLARSRAIGTDAISPVLLLQVLVLLHEAALDNVDHNVCFSYVDQHVVFKHYGVLLTHKDAITHA